MNIKLNDRICDFYNVLLSILKTYLIGLTIFMCFRTALLLCFGYDSEIADYKLDLLKAYFTGVRFDTVVLAYGLSIPFILNYLTLVIPDRILISYKTLVLKITFWNSLFFYAIILVICFIDFFFFMFFQSHFNKLLFGLAGWDIRAIFVSVWKDYPVISILVITLVLLAVLARLLRFILKKDQILVKMRPTYHMVMLVVIALIYVIALRGSLWTSPISKYEDTLISPNLFLNELTMNGVFSLVAALSEDPFAKDQEFTHIVLPDDNQDLFVNTPSNEFLEKNRPHVVFVLMESMGSHYFNLHSSSLNILGALEEQFPYCTVFRNFLPWGKGTIQSLDGILINYPQVTLADAQSSFIKKPLSSSVALPFFEAGYQTHFITGEDLKFCHLDKFLPLQYFQNIEGKEELLRSVDNAEAGTWGAYDEYVFNRVFEILSDARDKPQFFFVMTVTNHTPYDVPDSYKPYPIELPDRISKSMKTNENLAIKSLTTYQYSTDSLGKFINKVRKSEYGENTIIFATGDHSSLQLFNYPYSKLFQKLSVPLIACIPDLYRPTNTPDISRFGSHKDIFPTLFALSLTDAKYLKTGYDLYDPNVPNEYRFAVHDHEVFMNKDGAIILESPPLLYAWQKTHDMLLQPTTLKKNPNLKVLLRSAHDYKAKMYFAIKEELYE